MSIQTTQDITMDEMQQCWALLGQLATKRRSIMGDITSRRTSAALTHLIWPTERIRVSTRITQGTISVEIRWSREPA